MAGNQEEITAKKDRERDKRLRKTYGITLEQWRQIYDIQNGCCAICGRHFGTFNAPPNVDHKHFKVQATRAVGGEPTQRGWFACVDEYNVGVFAKTEREAIRSARKEAMPFSIRGLLCPGRHTKAMRGGCNRLLGRVDNREWLQKADSYLVNPPARKVLDKI